MLSSADLRKRPMAAPERGALLARLRDRLAGLSPRRLLPVMLAGTGALLVAWLAGRYVDRPIAKLDVEGEFHRVAVGQIEAAVKEFRGKGFVSVDLETVQGALESIAWVDHARVARRWPDELQVILTEHVPAARWGEHGLVNTRGELFLRDAQQVLLELPQLLGPEGTQQQVTRLYFELAPQLLEVGLRLARVELDARGAWQLELTNGVRVQLGRQDVRARLERLVHSAGALLASQGGAIRYIDMRYSNGFSVGWNAAARFAQGAGAAISDG